MSKTQIEKEKKAADVIKYPTEALLKSKALSKYQPDYARAILTKPEYTLDEAISAIERALKKEV